MFAKNYAALILPGGFGVMKNLSTYAVAAGFPKDPPTILPEARDLILAFHRQQKPIGAICIAPILLAHCFHGCTITLGPLEGDAQSLAKNLGAKLVDRSRGGIAVDADAKLVSTPAYMVDGAGPAQVYADVGNLVECVHELITKKP